MSNLEDNQLVRMACGNNVRAFEILVERHYDFMYRIAYRWCGNRVDAEDITHNAFLKMADNLRSFRFESSFRSWLCRLVINAAKDGVRFRQNESLRNVEISENLAIHSEAENNTYAHEIFSLVQQLPEDQRIALILVFGEGLTHKEAADIEKCPEGTIAWRIHEARKNLEYLIKGGGQHER